ncbi:MAG: SsrA-binding protein [Armatimonadetes bacterium 55-13]|nr:SsrA-binding protein SmpB [Armatimonadota bacterium]OJU64882.1 MAG: SsrA-binding protein [Armatimonadetes bacterium 55-13]
MAKKGADKKNEGPRSILNRRARFDYHIEDSYEAGIELVGSEVKSIFLGRANLTDAYCRVIKGQLFLLNLDVDPYEKAAAFLPERRRDRRLLMHRKEINLLERKAMEKGFSLIPLKMYFNSRGKVKVEVGLGRGKAQYDKREKIAKDDTRRELERVRSLKF